MSTKLEAAQRILRSLLEAKNAGMTAMQFFRALRQALPGRAGLDRGPGGRVFSPATPQAEREPGAVTRQAVHAWSMLADDARAAGCMERAKACVELAYWAYDAANPRERPGAPDDDDCAAAGWASPGVGGTGPAGGMPGSGAGAVRRDGGGRDGSGRVVSLHLVRTGSEAG